jgi:hypothetical protein
MKPKLCIFGVYNYIDEINIRQYVKIEGKIAAIELMIVM